MTEINQNISDFWDRLKHPILGAFASSWVILNWEVVYLLLCGIKDPSATIDKINQTYLVSTRMDHLFWLPLLSMAIFLFVGPETRSRYITFLNLTVAKRKFRDSKVRGEEPVSRNEYEILSIKLKEVENQRDIYLGAWNLVENRDVEYPGGKMQATEIIRNYLANYEKRDAQEKEITLLKAELQKCKDGIGKQ